MDKPYTRIYINRKFVNSRLPEQKSVKRHDMVGKEGLFSFDGARTKNLDCGFCQESRRLLCTITHP